VPDGRAKERGKGLSLKAGIIGIGAAAGEKPRILAAFDML
jgi:hypothetical protein